MSDHEATHPLAPSRRLDLRHDGNGAWVCDGETDGTPDLPQPGGDVAMLHGALDCDLGLSPLTNVMPIRRAGLDRHAGSEDFLMAWISGPDLAVHASGQRYEHIRRTGDGSVVRYIDRGLFSASRPSWSLTPMDSSPPIPALPSASEMPRSADLCRQPPH